MIRLLLLGPCFLLLTLLSAFAQKSQDSSKVRRNFLVVPVILKSPETRWGGGVASSFTFRTHRSQPDSVLRTSNIQVLGLYTLRKQRIVGLEGVIYFPSEKYILRFHGTYSFFPDKFWGIGDFTPKKNMVNYKYEQVYIFPQLLRKVYKHFFVGVSLEYQRVFKMIYKPHSLFQEEKVTGARTSTIPGAGCILTWDTRNNAFSSTGGHFLEVSATVFNSATFSDFNYTNFIIDARKYFSTFRGQVLALQTYANLNKGNVPYLSLGALGGSMIMRGYYSGRFRDKNLWAAQAEYRIPLWGRFGVVGFVAAGQVAHDLKDFNITGLKLTYGGGIRFAIRKDERLNLRFDYGVGKRTHGAYITVAEAF